MMQGGQSRGKSAALQYVLLGAALGFIVGHTMGSGMATGQVLERRELRQRIKELQSEHEARDGEVLHMRNKLKRMRDACAQMRAAASEAEQARIFSEYALHDLAEHARNAHEGSDGAAEKGEAEEEEAAATPAPPDVGGGVEESLAPYNVRGLDLPLARAENGTIIVIPVNLGYLGFGLNLVCSLRALNIRHYALLAMDAEVLDVLQERGLPVFADPDLPFISSKAAQWADPNFHRLVCTKLVTVTNLLKRGLNVVLTDADIVWRKLPWEHMRWDLSLTFSIGSCHRELPDNKDLSRDRVAKLNTGYYFARPQPAVIDLFSRAYQICKRGNLMGDQPAINTAIHQDKAGGGRPKYTYGFFDGCLFANGCVYFKHLCENTTRRDPVLVHANFIVGRKKKINSLRKHGLWNDQCVADLGGAPGLPPREGGAS